MRKAGIIGAAVVFLLAGSVPAQANERLAAFVSKTTSGDLLVPFALGTDGPGNGPVALDYNRFAHELVAFVLKEIFPDSGDDYDGFTPTPSRVFAGGRQTRSDFGAHCLVVLGRIRSEMLPGWPGGARGAGGANLLAPITMVGGTALVAVRQLWPAVRNHVEGDRSGFALNPKVGSRKLGVALTWRW